MQRWGGESTNFRSAVTYSVALVPVALVMALAGAHSVASQVVTGPESYEGDALVGVDELGRVLIALDAAPADGTVDHYFRFTATERLDGVWSEIETDATINVAKDLHSLVFRGEGHLLSLALEPSSARTVHAESITLEAHSGWELHHTSKPTGRELSELDVRDLTTWPPGYERDFLGERIASGQQWHDPTVVPATSLCASRPSLGQTALSLGFGFLTSSVGSPSSAVAVVSLLTPQEDECDGCGDDCSSGGCGAEFCSIDACSVGCSGGGHPRYACCQDYTFWEDECICEWCPEQVAPAPIPVPVPAPRAAQ